MKFARLDYYVNATVLAPPLFSYRATAMGFSDTEKWVSVNTRGMAEIKPDDFLRLPARASLMHRQRFYFLRHGQSVNNLRSMQDEADKPFQENAAVKQRRLVQSGPGPLQHLLCRQQGSRKQQRRMQRGGRSAFSKDYCTSEGPERRTLQLQQPQQPPPQQQREPSQQHEQQGPDLHVRSQEAQEGRPGRLEARQSLARRQSRSVAPSQVESGRDGDGSLEEHAGEASQVENGGPRSLEEQAWEPTGRRESDPSLTELGRRQAAAAAYWVQRHVQQMLRRARRGSKRRGEQLVQHACEGLPSPAIKKIVCSPMRRAVETAAEIRKVLTVDVYIHPLLFEQGGLFSGPREVAPSYSAAGPGSGNAAAAAHGRKSGVCGASGDKDEASKHAGIMISHNCSRGDVPVAPPQVCGSRPVQTREARKQPEGNKVETKAARKQLGPKTTSCNRGACTGMTLQEIQALLPGVKVIIPKRVECPFWKRNAVAHTDNTSNNNSNDEEAVGAAAGLAVDFAPWKCTTAQENVLPEYTEARTTSVKETPHAGAGEGASVVQSVQQAEAVGGHYCEEWTRGGCSWWCGGREKLVDTVARAAEIVSWMQSECRLAQGTGGSVLMVMHGLMMDLIVKALMFPFPSASSACPYLDLLARSLRAQEAAIGKPFYNMPQQTAYFTASNCSFCCFELAAAPQDSQVSQNRRPSRSATAFYGAGASALLRDPGAREPFKLPYAEDAAELKGGVTHVLESEGVHLRKRDLEHEDGLSCAPLSAYGGAARLDTPFTGLFETPARAKDAGAADAVRYTDGVRTPMPLLELDASQILLNSSHEATRRGRKHGGRNGRSVADVCVELGSALRGADAADGGASAANDTAPATADFRTTLADPAPALVSALIEWNVSVVDPQLYTGQTLGSSVIMSC